jgi:hypothetical protein
MILRDYLNWRRFYPEGVLVVSAELSKCYELLGVSPGVSAHELKTAHRDMAKVWHPDRFSHDPRLQQKAQEKLKQINEAYDQLTLRKFKWQRPSPPPVDRNPPPSASNKYGEHSATQHKRWHFVILPLLVFGVVFFFTSRSLIRRQTESSVLSSDQTQASQPDAQRSSEKGSSAATDGSRNKNLVHPSSAKEAKEIDTTSVEPATAQLRPLATISVMIDPVTGLLARPECPVKSRMTYPSGSEPHQYCNASHPSKVEPQADSPRPKESRIKSIAKRVSTGGKWFVGSESSKSP